VEAIDELDVHWRTANLHHCKSLQPYVTCLCPQSPHESWTDHSAAPGVSNYYRVINFATDEPHLQCISVC